MRTITKTDLLISLLIIVSCPAIHSQSFGNDSIRYNPGHYIAIEQKNYVTEIKFLNDPSIVGVNKRYNWADLEPDSGVYDFSSVLADLDTLRGFNKQLVLFFVDKSFSGQNIMPEYLSDYTLSEGNIVIAHRWHPYIIERLSILADTLASVVDSIDNFEGIALQESALSLSNTMMSEYNYTPEAYRDALIEVMSNMATSFRQSRIIWYMNFFPQNTKYLSAVAEALTPFNIMLCGPDILPYRTGLITHTYPVYHEFYMKLPLGCSAQNDSYRHHSNDLSVSEIEELPEEGYIPMVDIFRFGRDNLKLNYIFWQYKTWASGGQFSVFDALKVMQQYPVFNFPFSNYEEKTRVNPNSNFISYQGAINKTTTDTSAILLRFTDDYIEQGEGFSADRARTQSGVSIRFKTGSPQITMHFDSLENAIHRWRNFAVFRNGILYKENISALSFTIDNPEEEVHEYEVCFPSLSGLVFKGLDIVKGYKMETITPENKSCYVAIGNSITHGVGQTMGSHLTYPYHIAKSKGYRLFNFGIGGSRINYDIIQNIAALDKEPELITVLWGYNDAVYPMEDLSVALVKYDTLLTRLTRGYPDAEVVGILQTYTTTTTGNNSDNTIERLRNGQLAILKNLRLKYNNIRIVDGWEYTSDSDLADAVHLNNEGAVSLANGVLEAMEDEMVFAPSGAVWYYDERFAFSGDIDFIQFTAERDTIIQGNSCKVITKRHQLECMNRPAEEFIYTENNRVMLWNEQTEKFELLYDFNARAGDSWEVNVQTADTVVTGSVTVDSVYYLNVNGEDLLTLDVTYAISWDAFTQSNSTSVTERIGDHNYLFAPHTRELGPCDANRSGGLRCYSDADLGLYKRDDLTCDHVQVGVREEKLKLKSILYPNPGAGVFFIRPETDSFTHFQVFAFTGRLILEEKLISQSIDLTGSPEGIYLVRLFNEEGASAETIISNVPAVCGVAVQ